MAHDVRAGELADGDVLDALEHPHRLLQARDLVPGQVYLRHVARDDHPRAEAYAREEHFHLLARGVLSLVEYDKAVVQRPAAHICQRRDLYVAALEVLVIRLRPKHLEERVVEGPQVGVHFALQVAGEEAQALTSLHRRAREDYPVHLLRPERRHCLRHGEVGLARTGRSDAERDRIFIHRVHIGLLTQGLGLYRLALCRYANNVPGELGDLGLPALGHELQYIPHVLCVYRLAARGQLQKAVYRLFRCHDVLGFTAYAELVVPVRHTDAQLRLYYAQVLIKGPEHAYYVLHPVYRQGSLYHLYTSYLFRPGLYGDVLQALGT